MVTHIGDRESDLYEQWATIPVSGRRSRDEHNHVLTRTRHDRCLAGQDGSLYTYLSQQPCEGTCSVQVLADSRLEREAREAWLSVRMARVHIA